jgi:hypothetical protein
MASHRSDKIRLAHPYRQDEQKLWHLWLLSKKESSRFLTTAKWDTISYTLGGRRKLDAFRIFYQELRARCLQGLLLTTNSQKRPLPISLSWKP